MFAERILVDLGRGHKREVGVVSDEVMYKTSKSCSHLFWARLHHLLFEVDAMEFRPIGKFHQPFQVLPVGVLTIGPFDGENDAIEGLYLFFAFQNSEQKGR